MNPPSPLGTISEFTTTQHGSVVTYVCSDGYESVAGNHSLKCESGIWTGDLLICEITGKSPNMYTYNIMHTISTVKDITVYMHNKRVIGVSGAQLAR